jgi:predicted amidophosphoribosyltransferase
MKECQTIQEKVDNLAGAFAADPAVIAGKSVIILDDIYQSGFSINEVGRAVRDAGARLVLGLTATKTAHDLAEETTYDGD